jgi:hypothetical protein
MPECAASYVDAFEQCLAKLSTGNSRSNEFLVLTVVVPLGAALIHMPTVSV